MPVACLAEERTARHHHYHTINPCRFVIFFFINFTVEFHALQKTTLPEIDCKQQAETIRTENVADT